MPLETFTKSTFKNDLFDYLDELFEEAESRHERLADHDFLGRLSRLSIKDETHVSQLIQEIQLYVKQHQSAGYIVQKLYQLVQFDFKNNLKFLIDSVDDDPVKKDEFVQLIMMHWRQEGFYNGYLVNTDNPECDDLLDIHRNGLPLIPSIAVLYHRLNQVISNDSSENQRIQIIIRHDEHYIPIDIDKKARSCFVIDAAADAKELIVRDFVHCSPHIDKLFYVAQHEYLIPLDKRHPDLKNDTTISRIQKDRWSCSVFSLEYSRLSANQQFLHDWLLQHAEVTSHDPSLYALPWDALDPEFVRISQSPTYKYYYAKNRTERTPLEDTFFLEDGFTSLKNQFKTIAYEILNQHSEEELRSILSPRFSPIAFSTKSSLSPTSSFEFK